MRSRLLTAKGRSTNASSRNEKFMEHSGRCRNGWSLKIRSQQIFPNNLDTPHQPKMSCRRPIMKTNIWSKMGIMTGSGVAIMEPVATNLNYHRPHRRLRRISTSSCKSFAHIDDFQVIQICSSMLGIETVPHIQVEWYIRQFLQTDDTLLQWAATISVERRKKELNPSVAVEVLNRNTLSQLLKGQLLKIVIWLAPENVGHLSSLHRLF